MKPDPAGATSPQISLREYIEAKIEGERETNRNFRISTAEEFRLFKESLSKEILSAAASVDKELVHLNELRKEVTTDRANFVAIGKFEADMKARDSKIEAIEAKAAAKAESIESLLSGRIDPLETWQARSGDLKIQVGANENRIKALEEWRAATGKVEAQVSGLGTRLDSLEDWKNKLLGIGIMVSLLSGLVGAFLMRMLSVIFAKGTP